MSERQVVSLKTSLLVWLALLILLVATWGSAYIPLSPLSNALNMLIAIIQTLLILIFYMHLKYTSYLNRLVAAVGFVWILIMFGLTLSDYVTRPDRVLTEKQIYKRPAISAQERPTQLP